MSIPSKGPIGKSGDLKSSNSPSELEEPAATVRLSIVCCHAPLTNLMITQAKIADHTVVFQDVSAKFLYFWLVFEMEVSLKEAPVHLNDLT